MAMRLIRTVCAFIFVAWLTDAFRLHKRGERSRNHDTADSVDRLQEKIGHGEVDEDVASHEVTDQQEESAVGVNAEDDAIGGVVSDEAEEQVASETSEDDEVDVGEMVSDEAEEHVASETSEDDEVDVGEMVSDEAEEQVASETSEEEDEVDAGDDAEEALVDEESVDNSEETNAIDDAETEGEVDAESEGEDDDEFDDTEDPAIAASLLSNSPGERRHHRGPQVGKRRGSRDTQHQGRQHRHHLNGHHHRHGNHRRHGGRGIAMHLDAMGDGSSPFGPTKDKCNCDKWKVENPPNNQWKVVWWVPQWTDPIGKCLVPKGTEATAKGCKGWEGAWQAQPSKIHRLVASSSETSCGDSCEVVKISKEQAAARYKRLNDGPKVTGYHLTKQLVCKSILGKGGHFWLGTPGEAGSALYFGMNPKELPMKTSPASPPCILKCTVLIGNAAEKNTIAPKCGHNFTAKDLLSKDIDGTVIDNACTGWEFGVYFVDQILDCTATDPLNPSSDLGKKTWSTLPLGPGSWKA